MGPGVREGDERVRGGAEAGQNAFERTVVDDMEKDVKQGCTRVDVVAGLYKTSIYHVLSLQLIYLVPCIPRSWHPNFIKTNLHQAFREHIESFWCDIGMFL